MLRGSINKRKLKVFLADWKNETGDKKDISDWMRE